MNFKENVEHTIINAPPATDKKELLIDIFKSTIAQFFEWYLINKNNGNKLPFDSVVESKNQLIREFRGMSIPDIQQSVEWYENLFDTTIKEIFNEASHAHAGVDSIFSSGQGLHKKQNGLYVPKGL
jgi:hypothetical protein